MRESNSSSARRPKAAAASVRFSAAQPRLTHRWWSSGSTAGVPLDMAMEMLGMELPGQMTYDDFRKRIKEEKEEAVQRQRETFAQQRQFGEEQPPPGEQREELRRWQTAS